MCGIVLLFGQRAKERIQSCLDHLKHRGPDDAKIYRNGQLSLGFSRLAINDKSKKGQQPHSFQHYISSINGEIFNSISLTKTFNLPKNSENDCHIVAPLFNKLGGKLIEQLDGFYAGVIYDTQSNTVYTLRDHIGKKPLFIGRSGSETFIVSELKALSKIDTFEALPLGVCEINLNNASYSRLTAHSLPTSHSSTPPPNNTTNNSHYDHSELRTLIEQAIIKRLPNHNEPTGIFLSGGLDSSVIASVVTKHRKDAIYYCLANKDSNDYKYMLELINHLSLDNIRFVELPPASQLNKLIQRVVYVTHSYNPSIISNGICSFLLSQAARRDDLKIIFSGEGADELFGGYHRFDSGSEWMHTRKKLLQDMQFTELRRLDLTCMANSIESRCPFLDKKVFNYAHQLSYADLYHKTGGAIINKHALRVAFSNALPSSITQRKKVSFDVGSGIRKQVVRALTSKNSCEKKSLFEIWQNFFLDTLTTPSTSKHEYFHSYPAFNEAISHRGSEHK